MNRKFALLAALVAGLLPAAAVSQVAPAPPASATPAPPAAQPAPPPVAPQAIPAKIALIVFEEAVISTNEGQRAMEELQKKYEPKQKQFEATGAEIETLKKQASATTLSQEERAAKLKTIDTKEKILNHDVEDTRTQFQSDQQEAYAAVAKKFDVVMKKYVADNGYTVLINAGGQDSPVMWALPETDISLAVIAAYNAASGVTAPPPPAPSATRPAPRSAAPATPHTTTPKPPSQ